MNRILFQNNNYLVTYSNLPEFGGHYPAPDPSLTDYLCAAAYSGPTPQDALRYALSSLRETAPLDLLEVMHQYQIADDEAEDPKEGWRFSVRFYWKTPRVVYLNDGISPEQKHWDGALWVRRYKDFVTAVTTYNPETVVCASNLTEEWSNTSYEGLFGEEYQYGDIRDGAASLRWLLEHVEEQLSTVPGYRVPKAFASAPYDIFDPFGHEALQPWVDRIDALRKKADQGSSARASKT